MLVLTYVEVHSSGAFVVFATDVCTTEGVTLVCGAGLTVGICVDVGVMGAILGSTLGSLLGKWLRVGAPLVLREGLA